MHTLRLSGLPVARTMLTTAGAAILFAIAPFSSASAYTLGLLHSFCKQTYCTDGQQPGAGLLSDSAGNLYGTTIYGGTGGLADGGGTAFKLVPNADKTRWKEYVIHNFCGASNCTDGAYPYAGLIMDVDGNLYGTTNYGGRNFSGVVFQLTHGTKGWKLHVLYNFCSASSCTDGESPFAGLTYAGQAAGKRWDESSPLYGTTPYGGKYGNGVAFQIVPAFLTWQETVIHNFELSSQPNELLMDGSGNLYGTSQFGGKYGYGLMYKLAHDTWSETTLKNFCADKNCADGGYPVGRLFMDGSGNLFGATHDGGAGGYGAVFERTSGGRYSVIHSFCPSGDCLKDHDGANPESGLIMGSSGHLFGTTFQGGYYTGNCQDYGCGTAFKLSKNTDGSWSETFPHWFCRVQDCDDGGWPAAPVIIDGSGNLYGTVEAFGRYNGGNVFRLKP